MSAWRVAWWSLVPLVLLVALVAMQFTEEVDWSSADFVLAGALLLAVGTALELAARTRSGAAYRAGTGLALGAMLALVWVNGAVGILGSENNDANLMYFAVIAVGILGALVARFRARGMALALFAAASAQAAVAAIALFAGLGVPATGPVEIVMLNGFFAALFGGAGTLFRQAAKVEP